MQYALIIRHAQLHRHQGIEDIAVKDGHFAYTGRQLLPKASLLVLV